MIRSFEKDNIFFLVIALAMRNATIIASVPELKNATRSTPVAFEISFERIPANGERGQPTSFLSIALQLLCVPEYNYVQIKWTQIPW